MRHKGRHGGPRDGHLGAGEEALSGVILGVESEIVEAHGDGEQEVEGRSGRWRTMVAESGVVSRTEPDLFACVIGSGPGGGSGGRRGGSAQRQRPAAHEDAREYLAPATLVSPARPRDYDRCISTYLPLFIDETVFSGSGYCLRKMREYDETGGNSLLVR
nr:hypothetical protein CFP56_01457 [Quercus suber]